MTYDKMNDPRHREPLLTEGADDLDKVTWKWYCKPPPPCVTFHLTNCEWRTDKKYIAKIYRWVASSPDDHYSVVFFTDASTSKDLYPAWCFQIGPFAYARYRIGQAPDEHSSSVESATRVTV